MKTYSATYKFEKAGITFEAKVNGQVFETANEEIDFYHVADLGKGFTDVVLNSAIWAISDEQNGMFVNGKPAMMLDTQLMQSNANEAYAVFVDGNLYPLTMNVSVVVTSNPFELLKN